MMKSYVNKNQYGYDVMGIIVDEENKTVTYYTPCMMPIGKHKKASKKAIKEMFYNYKDMGYKTVIK